MYKQKTAYEMRISDWSSDECSSDLDVLSEDALAGADLLILAQPRALTPVELLVADERVRAGGRALLFADPALHWAGELPPHMPRAPRTYLIRPLLPHWGLQLLPGAPSFRLRRPPSSAQVTAGGPHH